MISRTLYESSINSYQRIRDGWVDYLALCQHNIGSSRWDKILEYAKSYVMKREWNGHNHRFNLWSHICKHLGTNNEMMRAYQHVQYELLNEHTRVGRLIKSILSNDPSFVYDITHIQWYQVQLNDFYTADDFLFLTSPTTTSTSINQRISSLKRNTKNTRNVKKGSSTGSELRCYNKK